MVPATSTLPGCISNVSTLQHYLSQDLSILLNKSHFSMRPYGKHRRLRSFIDLSHVATPNLLRHILSSLHYYFITLNRPNVWFTVITPLLRLLTSPFYNKGIQSFNEYKLRTQLNLHTNNFIQAYLFLYMKSPCSHLGAVPLLRSLHWNWWCEMNFSCSMSNIPIFLQHYSFNVNDNNSLISFSKKKNSRNAFEFLTGYVGP